jgi:predicted PurR-regulated permease PerM
MTQGPDRPDTGRVAAELAAQTRRLPERLGRELSGPLYRTVALLLLAAIVLRHFDILSRVLLVTFLGVIVAMTLNAIVVRIPVRRSIATALVALAGIAAVGGLIWVGLRALLPQIRALASDLPALQERVLGWQEWLQTETGMELELVGDATEALLRDPFGFVMMLLARTAGVLEIVGLAVLILFGALFIVAKPNEQLLTPLMRAVPRDSRPAVRRMLHRLAARLVGWLKGTAISMVLVGILSFLAFWLLGAPYPMLLAVWAGLIEVIPIVGPWIGGGTAVLVTLLHDPGAALWIAVAVLVIQQIESNVVRPFAMSGAAELHPFVTLIALLLFAAMFGFLGALLALPLMLVVITVVEVFWVEETIHTDDDTIAPVVEE